MIMRISLFSLLFFIVISLWGQDSETRRRVQMVTNKGDIIVELYNETPLHRDNFIKLCESHFYDSLLFHRVIENFMIQGGDPDSRHALLSDDLGDGGPGYTLPAEIVFPKYFHRRGVLAAAREGDEVNPERRSSGSQFYIVWGSRFTKSEMREMVKTVSERSKGEVVIPASLQEVYRKTGGSPHLDGLYTVFGEVVEGLDVVERIQKVATIENDRPFDDVVILSTKVLR